MKWWNIRDYIKNLGCDMDQISPSYLQADQSLRWLQDARLRPPSSTTPHLLRRQGWYHNDKGEREGWEGGGIWAAWTAPSWPSSRGRLWPGKIDCQGVEAPGPLAFMHKKIHPIRYQAPYYVSKQNIKHGGRGGDTRETEGQATGAPLGANMDLAACQGRQKGDKRTRDISE